MSRLSLRAFYADPLVGESLAFLVLFGSAALVAACLFGDRRPDRRLLIGLAVPVALWALGSAFLLFLALALLTVLLTDLAIVNGFFVRPKMLPAAAPVATPLSQICIVSPVKQATKFP